MRKIIFSQPAARTALGLEAAEIADLPDMPQADDVRDDVQDDAAAMDQIATEAFTLLTRIAALEDIAEVIETQVQEARPSDVVLVDIATDLATDGTDAAEGDVTPGLESALGGTISTEGILEAAKKFVGAVYDRLKAFLDRFKAFLGSAKALVRVEKRRLKTLASAAEKMEDSSDKTIVVGNQLARLCVGGKVPKNNADVVNALKSIAKDAGVVAGTVLEIGHNYVSKVTTAFGSQSNRHDLATELVSIVREVGAKYVAVANHGKLKGASGYDATIVADFGSYRLMNLWPEVMNTLENKDASDVAILNKAYYIGGWSTDFWLDSNENFGGVAKEAKSAELPAASKKEVHAVLDAALAALDVVEKSFSKYDRAWSDSDRVYMIYGTFGWTEKTRANKGIGLSIMHNACFPVYATIRELAKSVGAAMKYAEKSIKAAGVKVESGDAPELETVPAV
jgi:hypothetical protein